MPRANGTTERGNGYANVECSVPKFSERQTAVTPSKPFSRFLSRARHAEYARLCTRASAGAGIRESIRGIRKTYMRQNFVAALRNEINGRWHGAPGFVNKPEMLAHLPNSEQFRNTVEGQTRIHSRVGRILIRLINAE